MILKNVLVSKALVYGEIEHISPSVRWSGCIR